MEQTIEERARSIYPPLYDYEDCCQSYDGVQTDKRNAYIAGAKDQRKIDVKRTLEIIDYAFKESLSNETLEGLKLRVKKYIECEHLTLQSEE